MFLIRKKCELTELGINDVVNYNIYSQVSAKLGEGRLLYGIIEENVNVCVWQGRKYKFVGAGAQENWSCLHGFAIFTQWGWRI